MVLYGEISKDYRTVPSMFPAKNPKTIIPTLGELRNASPKKQKIPSLKTKMEQKNVKIETLCFGLISHKTLDWRAIISCAPF